MQLGFPEFTDPVCADRIAKPACYRGLYAFHKYWGKKPAEPIRYLIEHLCPKGGMVADPFLGSGVSAMEAMQLKRRFVGVDINPAAIRLSRLLISPPNARDLETALARVGEATKNSILESYTANQRPATHYVWQNGVMQMVWFSAARGRERVELRPTEQDISLAERFSSYEPKRLRPARFFTNSRINSTASLKLTDLFTGRALRNIELLLAAIDKLPSDIQEPMRLSLTAAVGQMSRMVFAITGRGKKTGARAERMEVGSWVIGYWRPDQHFEINVWKCYERRVQKLIKAVNELEGTPVPCRAGTLRAVSDACADYALITGDTLEVLPTLPEKSVDLIITDPPHGDRIPYLELSELWNVILGESPPFESEIVVSNAKERGKKSAGYHQSMSQFFEIAGRKLRETGYLVLFFNARTTASWKFFEAFSQNANTAGMTYCGCFPMEYSAASVVQDNREGALRSDYGLVFSRSAVVSRNLAEIPGWTVDLPALLEKPCP